jgi:hypothetical protein
VYFVETSALVKAYVTEPGSETVTGAFGRFRGSLFTSELVAIETLGTLTRLKRSRTITRSAYRKLRREFEMDLSEIFRIAPIAPDTLSLMSSLRRGGRAPAYRLDRALIPATQVRWRSGGKSNRPFRLP